MNRRQKILRQLEEFLNAPGKELGRWGRLLRFPMQLGRFCIKQLNVINAPALSSALSFRTIFAMIPTIVLAILVLKQVGGFESSKENLHQFLDKTGFTQIVIMQEEATETGEGGELVAGKVTTAADKIEELVVEVESKLSFAKLGTVGVVLLIWTAITLLTTIERALNRIFGARESRGLWRRILLYWSVLTLGPVLLSVAIYFGQRAIGIIEGMPVLSLLVSVAGRLGPIVVEIFLLGALYKLMPNTKVSFRAALAGAAVAIPIWLVVKWAFGLYVQMVVRKASLYGALGAIPLFLMWLNFSWLIFLFGAVLAHTAANLSNLQMAEQAARIVLGPSELLAAAMAVGQPYSKGMGPVTFDQMREQLNLPDLTVQKLLDRLEKIGIVCPVDTDEAACYVLARPAERIGILEIMELGDEEAEGAAKMVYEQEIRDLVKRFKVQAREALGNVTLAKVITN